MNVNMRCGEGKGREIWRGLGNKFIGGNEEIFKFGFNLPITFS